MADDREYRTALPQIRGILAEAGVEQARREILAAIDGVEEGDPLLGPLLVPAREAVAALDSALAWVESFRYLARTAAATEIAARVDEEIEQRHLRVVS